MKKLDFMVGEWKGTAEYMAPGNRSIPMQSWEKVEYRTGGTTLLVEGRHTHHMPPQPPRVMHEALGIISFGHNGYKLRSWLASGMTGEFSLNLKDDGYTWSHPHPARPGWTMRYEAAFTETTWIEKGFESKDGKDWQPLMSMNLKKVQ